MIPFTPMKVLCVCGRRLGLHRYGNDACQNPNWRPGNGASEFLNSTFTPQRIKLATSQLQERTT